MVGNVEEVKMGMNHAQRMRAIEREAGAAEPDLIASATVLCRLGIGDVAYKRGETLTRAQLLAMKPANLRAMLAGRFIELQPSQPEEKSNAIRRRTRKSGRSL